MDSKMKTINLRTGTTCPLLTAVSTAALAVPPLLDPFVAALVSQFVEYRPERM